MTEIETKFKSKLELKTIYVENIKFSFIPNSDETRLCFDFDAKLEELEQNQFKVILIGEVDSENKMLDLSVKLIAVFEFEGDDLEIIKQNAIAIMFPFLRTQISTITCQPGLTPIIVPPININAYFEAKYKEELK